MYTEKNPAGNLYSDKNPAGNLFSYDGYGKSGDLYGRTDGENSDIYSRGDKYASYLRTGSTSDEINYDRNSDNLWASPPKRTVLDLPPTGYKSSTRNTYGDFNSRDKSSRGALGSSSALEDKYFSDNDVVTRGSKTRMNSYGHSADMRGWQRNQFTSQPSQVR